MILKNPIFLSHLLIYRQEVFSIVPYIRYITSITIHLLELMLKKDGNCNIVATMIILLHLSTGILPSLLIAFIYQLIFIGLFFIIIIRIHLIIEKFISCNSTNFSFVANRLFYIALSKSASAVFFFFIILSVSYFTKV